MDAELRALCAEIVATGLPVDEWRATESGDHFQRGHYHGGYEAIEDAFCFSFYSPDGAELWFQITLAEADDIAAGRMAAVEARTAER